MWYFSTMLVHSAFLSNGWYCTRSMNNITCCDQRVPKIGKYHLFRSSFIDYENVEVYLYLLIIYRYYLFKNENRHLLWPKTNAAFSWGFYGRSPHSGKNPTLDLSGDIDFFRVVIYITPSTKGSVLKIFNNNAYSRKHEPSLYKNIKPWEIYNYIIILYGIVDLKWGTHTQWSEWGECSASCGKGLKTKTRSRACNNPQPQYGGQPCKGDDVDIGKESCEAPPCPSK